MTPSRIMARAIHISDVHAGRQDDRIVEEMLLDIARLEPDVVLAGGDFTQRSRRAEWSRAAGWMDSLDSPVFATPGNHDLPLFDFPRRIVSPFGRYSEWIGNDLEPELLLSGLRCLAVKTAAPERRADGAISRDSLALLGKRASRQTECDLTILLTHHPVAAHPDANPGKSARGSSEALDHAVTAEVDLLLSGHTHRRRSGPFVLDHGGRSMVVAHAGTACSTRQRGNEPQAWQTIDSQGERMVITPHIWDKAEFRFRTGPVTAWERSDSGWRESSAGA